MDEWNRVPVALQQKIFGRHKITGIPLNGGANLDSPLVYDPKARSCRSTARAPRSPACRSARAQGRGRAWRRTAHRRRPLQGGAWARVRLTGAHLACSGTCYPRRPSRRRIRQNHGSRRHTRPFVRSLPPIDEVTWYGRTGLPSVPIATGGMRRSSRFGRAVKDRTSSLPHRPGHSALPGCAHGEPPGALSRVMTEIEPLGSNTARCTFARSVTPC
ncbi:hypothetical protein [Sphaerisporangium sp. NBC_01403]|uniref:hypothetical protein n=1 Tax=Sphaerisporangium sp. NBC_01403 TaxID=2903599 RepID=UPI003865355A